MFKAKTKGKLLAICSAIIGVVFAFITGVTYCASSISLQYGLNETSTAAYVGNQQYHIINDTTTNPVVFGEGSHNFEIAVQYSFAYNFDIRVKYTMSWSKKTGETSAPSTDNVIFNFANRDNIIYDENYIYLAQSTVAGNGKITLITGVEFVDPTNSAYQGRTLTITIGNNDVKVYKAQTSYSDSHMLVSDVVTKDATAGTTTFNSVAAQAWLQHKMNETAKAGSTTDAYVMMYNRRRNYEHGVQFPGLNSAYKKPVAADDYSITTGEEPNQKITTYTKNYVYAPVWTGGNRAYAGVEMYVVAGSTDLQFEIQVEGVWRTSGNADTTYENNIQFNYTKDWEFERYSQNLVSEDQGLWEVRSFKFSVQATKSRYINILDSIEITSAGEKPTADYRIVVREIVINPASAESTSFTYTESNSRFIQLKEVVSHSNVSKTYYSQDNISVVNTTTYSNNLYDTLEAAQKYYNGNITLINNTNAAKILEIDLKLNYHISNGMSTLYGANKKRAIDLIDRDTTLTYEPENAFDGTGTYSAINTLYYSCSKESSSLASINETAVQTLTVKLAPYSSVNVLTEYSVGAGLKDEVLELFDDPTTGSGKTHNRTEYYDVWTYLIPEIQDVTSSGSHKDNLTLETKQTTTNTVVSVKNNTTSKVTGVSIDDLNIKALGTEEFTQSTATNEPYAWSANYWKYYTKSGDVYTPVSQTGGVPTYTANQYYLRSQSYSDEDIDSLLNSFKVNATDSTIIENTSIVLMPGESVEIATINTTAPIIVSGEAIATAASSLSDITIINNGTSNAYIVNYSTSNAYYLRMKGTASGTNIANNIGDATNGYYSYYIGIVRPGQIINISTTENLTIGSSDKIVVSGNYSASILEADDYDWHEAAITKFNKFFNMK